MNGVTDHTPAQTQSTFASRAVAMLFTRSVTVRAWSTTLSMVLPAEMPSWNPLSTLSMISERRLVWKVIASIAPMISAIFLLDSEIRWRFLTWPNSSDGCWNGRLERWREEGGYPIPYRRVCTEVQALPGE